MRGLYLLALEQQARSADAEITRLLIQKRDIEFKISQHQSVFGSTRSQQHRIKRAYANHDAVKTMTT